MSQWITTPTELLRLLRKALVSLVPIAEEAHMPWREGEAYDDWDAISETLYAQIVVRSLEWAASDESGGELQLPKYDSLVEDYSTLSVLSVKPPGVESVDRSFVFHSYRTMIQPFDSIAYREVDARWRPVSDTLQTCAFEETQIVFERLEPGGRRRAVTQLVVEL